MRCWILPSRVSLKPSLHNMSALAGTAGSRGHAPSTQVRQIEYCHGSVLQQPDPTERLPVALELEEVCFHVPVNVQYRVIHTRRL